MRYFFRINDVPSHPEYQEPYAVFRWEVSDVAIISERWDPGFQGWKHFPRMIAWTGLGGDNDYVETTEVAATAFIERTASGSPQQP